jgi:hypothetical protein
MPVLPQRRAAARTGGVAERLKAPVLKTGIPQGIGGSNPSPSANPGPGRAAGWPPGPACRILSWLERQRQLGEVAESAEGSRLLSGYRGKTSVPGSNPGLSATRP